MYNGESYPFATHRQWVRDVDTLYIAHNVAGNHWVALEVQLLQKRIKVYDSYMSCNTENVIIESCKVYSRFIPLLLKEMAPIDERTKMSAKAYPVYRSRGAPQQGFAGDCGVYALKFIECLALGCSMDGLEDKIMPFARLKYAAELFDEVGSEGGLALV